MAERDPALSTKSPAEGLGADRSKGISWSELMAQDSIPAPSVLIQESYSYRGSDPIPAERYISEDFARLERERMWPYVWQFAAREEDLPEPGDFVVYENAGRSYLVSRQDDGSIRAMHNVCLHRGRKLRTEEGTTDSFVCPFHGFAWNKDGSFNSMPCQWDFPHLEEQNLHLPEAEVGRWQGYVFIREEKGGPSLEEFLAPLPEHFKRWRHEECASVMRVAKEVPANWKVVMEAFMEAWHTIVTHPQLLPFTGDSNAAYWTWGDNVNVNLVPFGVMSPHIEEGQGEQWIVDQFIRFNGRSADNYEEAARDNPMAIAVPEGTTARAALGGRDAQGLHRVHRLRSFRGNRRGAARRAGLQRVPQLLAVGRVHAQRGLQLAHRQDARHLHHGSSHSLAHSQGSADPARRAAQVPEARPEVDRSA